MKVKVSKVFAKAVNEIAEKYGKRFHAEVRTRKVGMWDGFCDADFNWETNEVRELVVTYPQDYYDYIIQSYEYGHMDQVIRLFNRMKGEQQKSFLMEVTHMGYILGERLQDFIIKSL